MARRMLGFIGVMLGFLFIFLGPMLRWYVTPRVEKAPNDVYDRKVAEGTGQYFIITEGRLSEPATIRNISIYKGEPQRSTEEVAVIQNFQRTLDVDRGADFDYHLETYAMDRVTGLAVHCCGETPPKEGHTLKLPFHLEKETYPLYNDTALKAFPAEFSGEEEVDGLLTYKFVSEVPQSFLGTLEVPGIFVGRPEESQTFPLRYYEATTTIWVEPTTGAVIKRSQQSHQWLVDSTVDAAGTVHETVLELAIIDVTDDAETVKTTADDVSAQVSQLKIISVYAPIALPIVGILLLVGGIVLLRRSEAEEESSPRATAGATAS